MLLAMKVTGPVAMGPPIVSASAVVARSAEFAPPVAVTSIEPSPVSSSLFVCCASITP